MREKMIAYIDRMSEPQMRYFERLFELFLGKLVA